ncbi:MAG: alpha/beta hydrolase fold domain-containing protein [Planctomycetota bacterium]
MLCTRVALFATIVLCALAARLFAQAPAEESPIDKPSVEAELRQFIEKYDTNGDGSLSAQERAALMKDMRSGKVELPEFLRARLAQEKAKKAKAKKGGQAAAPRLPAGVAIERDVVYGKAGDRELRLDILKPEKPSADKLPLVVFIHGGGWRNGSKDSGIGNVGPLAATGNYVGATVEYRLSGEAIWPAQIHDCKAAIRFLRANAAKWGGDPERIAVWGGSAGGHLVSLLGTSGDVAGLEGENGAPGVSSRVQAVVDFCGPSDLAILGGIMPNDASNGIALLLGGPVGQKMDEAKEASPATHISTDDPPFLIVHGTNDGTVPIRQAETFHTALEKAGVTAYYLKAEGAGHNLNYPTIRERVTKFLDKHLRGEDVTVADEVIQVEARP